MTDLTGHIKSTQHPCRVEPHQYAIALMRIWIRHNWPWAFALPILAVAIAVATLSVRYLLIAVVLVCLVFPHMIAWVYYYHALSPNSRMSILPHTIQVNDSGITLTYVPKQTQEQEQEQHTMPKPDYIPAKQIKKITYTNTLTIVHLTSGRYNIIAFPRHMPQAAVE